VLFRRQTGLTPRKSPSSSLVRVALWEISKSSLHLSDRATPTEICQKSPASRSPLLATLKNTNVTAVSMRWAPTSRHSGLVSPAWLHFLLQKHLRSTIWNHLQNHPKSILLTKITVLHMKSHKSCQSSMIYLWLRCLSSSHRNHRLNWCSNHLRNTCNNLLFATTDNKNRPRPWAITTTLSTTDFTTNSNHQWVNTTKIAARGATTMSRHSTITRNRCRTHHANLRDSLIFAICQIQRAKGLHWRKARWSLPLHLILRSQKSLCKRRDPMLSIPSSNSSEFVFSELRSREVSSGERVSRQTSKLSWKPGAQEEAWIVLVRKSKNTSIANVVRRDKLWRPNSWLSSRRSSQSSCTWSPSKTN